jgi:hypothetical protein
MLSEISQPQKDKYCTIKFLRHINQYDRERKSSKRWGRESGKLPFKGTEFQFGKMENFWI